MTSSGYYPRGWACTAVTRRLRRRRWMAANNSGIPVFNVELKPGLVSLIRQHFGQLFGHTNQNLPSLASLADLIAGTRGYGPDYPNTCRPPPVRSEAHYRLIYFSSFNLYP